MLTHPLLLALLAPLVAADQIYTVWASVIYNRMGERTPILANQQSILTTTGAQQSFSAGSFFRSRYLTATSGRIQGINANLLDSQQLYVLALDQQSSAASAQAFVQGLYPPVTLNSSSDPTSLASTQEYVSAPLGGYQYPQIHVSDSLDAISTQLGGNLNCPAFQEAEDLITANPQYQALRNSSISAYQAISPLAHITLTPGNYAFDYATLISEYVTYLALHNSTIASLLQTPLYLDPATNQSLLVTLKSLANAQSQFLFANMSAYNGITQAYTLPDTGGSISTIAGNMLAGLMLGRLENVVSAFSKGKQQPQLSVLFGDFPPLVSLFALMQMNNTSTNFTGLPEFASSAVFELYSRENSTNASFPDPSQLFVAFHFRNGTSNSTDLLEYATFNNGVDQPEMTWLEFQRVLTYINLGGPGDWCQQCGAQSLFCAAWNNPVTIVYPQSASTSKSLSPAAAGGVGAVVALAVAALIFGLVMLIGRIRFHRVPRSAKNELGGFKGSARLASDRDLVIPKNGVVVEEAPADMAAGHERTGSWEMKDADAKPSAQRISFDEDDLRVTPFSDPVKVHEQV